jgi:hypothetical protein
LRLCRAGETTNENEHNDQVLHNINLKRMQTLLVEIKKRAGLKILQELEQADLIRLIPSEKDDKPQKLSARLRGAISKETARKMQAELEQMRGEWQQRDI